MNFITGKAADQSYNELDNALINLTGKDFTNELNSHLFSKWKTNIVLIFVILFFILSGIYGLLENRKSELALKDSVLVIATIKTMNNTRGAEIINVQFMYENQIFAGTFGTYRWDSLAVNDKIRILVSKKYPDKYIKYVGVAK